MTDYEIHENLPMEEYDRIDAIRSGFIKRFRSCPASALIEKEQTPDMLVGLAIHSFVLDGEEAFWNQYAILPEPPLKKGTDEPISKNTNEWKTIRAQFTEKNEGKCILPPEIEKMPTHEFLMRVRASLKAHPRIKSLLEGEKQELSLVWTDTDSGLRCKARIDKPTNVNIIAELKKTSNLSKFRNQMVDLGYALQTAFYYSGATVCGLAPDSVLFIVIEADPMEGFPCMAGYLSPDWLEAAQRENARLLGLIKECRERDFWPPYKLPGHIYSLDQIALGDLIEDLELPVWGF